jgi:hypothetical protein
MLRPAPAANLEPGWSIEMGSTYLTFLALIPFALAVAFMLWVLWNLTLELRPRRSLEISRKVIPLQTFAYRPSPEQGVRILRLDIRP